jgi:hypothetical protein
VAAARPTPPEQRDRCLPPRASSGGRQPGQRHHRVVLGEATRSSRLGQIIIHFSVRRSVDLSTARGADLRVQLLGLDRTAGR